MSSSSSRFWKEIVSYQITSGSISFVASSLIVIFIALNGLNKPYRRIIFGLSVSDMCQSFGIFAGPFLATSDAPQAHWGIGNDHTCRMDGFFYHLGMTAVPMYTVFLCVYYVCKLKNRMTDAQFTQRMETKVHAFIIIINLGLCLSALGMDIIDPTGLGNYCTATSLSAACKYEDSDSDSDSELPEEECNRSAVNFFVIVTYGVVPALSLFAIILCLGLIFWNVLWRERMFGTGNTRVESGGTIPERSSTSTNGHSNPQRNRNRYIPSTSSSGFPVSITPVLSSGLSLDEEVQTKTDSQRHQQHRTSSAMPSLDEKADFVNDDISYTNLTKKYSCCIETLKDTPNNTTRTRTLPLNEDHDHPPPPGDADDAVKQIASGVSDAWSTTGGSNLNVLASSANVSHTDTNHDDDRTDPQTMMTVPTTGGEGDHDVGAINSTNADTAENLARLYKKELLTQVCCYVLVYCLVTFPFILLFILQNGGFSRNLIRVICILHPLAGLFNIIVYTRWNVRSWRRSHPECSWLRAFWLVLKAGGDLPSEDNEM